MAKQLNQILHYWLLFGIFWILAKLPNSFGFAIGKLLGKLFFLFPTRAKDTTLKNLKLSFPHLTEKQRYKLAKRNFINVGISIIETSIAWVSPINKISTKFSIEGLENIEKSFAKGKGILLITSHFTSVELAARFIGSLDNFGILYKPHKKTNFAFMQNKFRQPHFKTYIASNEVKRLIKALKLNKAIWYAYDIDDKKKRSIFAPFFDIPTRTLTTAADLAKITGASLVPMRYCRNHDNKTYKIVFGEPLNNLADQSSLAVATNLNKEIESAIKQNPDQYIWQYKRFKTRPPGEKRFYFSSNFPPRWIGN